MERLLRPGPSIALVGIAYGNWNNSKRNLSNGLETNPSSSSFKKPKNVLDWNGMIGEAFLDAALDPGSMKNKRIGLFIHTNPIINSEENDELRKVVETQFPASSLEFFDCGLKCLEYANETLKKETIDMASCLLTTSKQCGQWGVLLLQPEPQALKTWGTICITKGIGQTQNAFHLQHSMDFPHGLLETLDEIKNPQNQKPLEKKLECRKHGLTFHLLFDHLNGKEETQEFWTNQMAQISDPTRLINSQHQTQHQLQAYKMEEIEISNDLYLDLAQVGRTYSLCLSSILQWSWHQILYIFKSHGVGTTTIGGTVVNSKILPLIVHHEDSVQEEPTLVERIHEIQSQMAQITPRTKISLSEILNLANPPITLDSLFVYQPHFQELASDKLDYPIILLASEDPTNSTIGIKVSYVPELFNSQQIGSMMDTFKYILNQIAREPLKLFKNLKWVQETKPEWEPRIMEFNGPKFLHGFVEEAALKYPQKIGLVYNGNKMTYETLNGKANQFAQVLVGNYGIQREDLVPIFLERNENLIIGILGILKAGGAYVPIDTTYPDRRISYILQDTNAKLVLTNEIHVKKLSSVLEGLSVQVISIDSIEFVEQVQKWDSSNLNLEGVETGDLAYCIYTSGTTGNPKGVLVEHRSIVNSLSSHAYHFFELRDGETSLEEVKGIIFSSVAFDAFLCEMFSIIIVGGECHLLSDPLRLSPHLLSSSLVENGITHIQLVPAVLAILPQNIHFQNLKKIGYGGGECRADVGAFWSSRVQLYNSYGPTETSVVAAGGFIDGSNMRDIGRPYHNSTCYIMDSNLNMLPALAVGELCISGIGLARAYLNHTEETNSKFINWKVPSRNLDSESSGIRLYRTGDLARWTLSGKLEYFGRNDTQVKVRGYRIELGEIERSLEEISGVQSCVVRVFGTSIVAYVVLDNKVSYELNDRTVEILKSKLPSYMIPTSIVQIPRIPLKSSGKIDYLALPVPPSSKNRSDDIDTRRTTLGPRNELESQITDIFSSVLDLEEVGTTEDFFKLGGDSIGAIQVVGAIHETLGLLITVQDIFDLKTVRNLYEHVISALVSTSQNSLCEEEEGASVDSNIISQESLDRLGNTEEIESIFLANSLQEGFIYHSLLRGENPRIGDAYNIQSVYKIYQKINEPMYRESWELMLHLYPALRLKFGWEDKIIQIIPKTAPLDFRYFDLRRRDRGDLWTTQEIVDAERKEGYKLDQGKLFRVVLIQEGDSEYTNIFSWHHSILDGWALYVLFSRVQEVYSNLVNGLETQNLEPDSTYSATQKYYQQNLDLHLSWWENEISKISVRNDISNIVKSTPNTIHLLSPAQKVQIEVPKDLLRLLRQISQSHSLTLNAIFQFTWHQILHVFGKAGVESTVTGTVVSGRNLPIRGIEHSVGLFINTLPLILNHSDFSNGSILQALHLIQSKVNELNARSCVPLSKLVAASSANPLFDSLFTFQNYPSSLKNGEEAELSWDLVELSQTLDYPIAVTCLSVEGRFEVHFEFCPETIQPNGIQVMSNTFLHILHQVGKEVKKPMAQLTFVPHGKIFQPPRETSSPTLYGSKVLHGLIEEAALNHPQKIGLVCNGNKISYETLNQKANHFARTLRKIYKVQSEDLIPIFLERDENLIIGILGILKAGGAFVPIDTTYPDQRISFIVQDTKAKLVLTNEIHAKKLRDLLRGIPVQVNSVDANEFVEQVESSDCSNLNLGYIESRNLAYCIYTSGTTGNPKGVLVEHRNILNSVTSHSFSFLGAGEEVKGAIFNSVVFDGFLFDVFCPAVCAGEFHLLSDKVRLDPGLLSSYLIENEITNIDLVPAMLALLPRDPNYPNLKKICYGAEECKADVGGFWSRKVQLYNSFGPVETSVAGTGGFIDGSNMRDIGVPLHNTTCYIMDPNFNLLPPLAVGELCISGLGLARGYLNNPKETDSKFIHWKPSLDSTSPTIRLYRTGDLGRWTLDGKLEYFGRNDNQANIRGYRVELREIESSIEKVGGVEGCVAQVIQDSIVAYIVLDNMSSYKSNESTIEILKSQLPSYMIPSSIIQIPRIPLKSNGKIDYSALPIPINNSNPYVQNNTIEEPKNEFEFNSRKIWSAVLGMEPGLIGVTTSFFELGGNSMKSIELISKTREDSGITLSLKDIFEQKTIQNLCNLLLDVNLGNELNPHHQMDSHPKFLIPPYLNSLLKDCASKGTLEAQRIELELSKSWDEIRVKEVISRLLNSEEWDVLKFQILQESQNADFELIYKNQMSPEDLLEVSDEKSKDAPIWMPTQVGIPSSICKFVFLKQRNQLLLSASPILSSSRSLNQIIETVLDESKEFLSDPKAGYSQWVLLTQDILKLGPILRVPFIENPFDIQTFELDVNWKKILPTGFEIEDLVMTTMNYVLEECYLVTRDGRKLQSKTDFSQVPGFYEFTTGVLAWKGESMMETLGFVRENRKQAFSHPSLNSDPCFTSTSKNPIHVRFENLDEEFNFNPNIRSPPKHQSPSFFQDILIQGGEVKLVVQVDNKRVGIPVEFKNKFIRWWKELMDEMSSSALTLVQPRISDFPDFTPYVAIMEKGGDPYSDSTKKTLICLPPDQGGAECYIGNIVPALRSSCNLVLFNNFPYHLSKFDPESLKGRSLSSFAAEHIFQIKMLQAHGPYKVFGWSIGGNMSFEICRQLLLGGDQVESLVLMDSYFNLEPNCTKFKVDSGDNSSLIYLQESPFTGELFSNTRILLFKGQTSTETNQIYAHYVGTKFNYLDTLVPGKFIQLSPLSDHNHWIHKPKEVIEICNVIRQKILSST